MIVGLSALACGLMAPASASAIPTQTEAPSIVNPPNPPYEGQTLNGDDGEYSAPLQTVQLSRQWRRCDGAGANCVDIAGAEDDQYVVAADDIGSTIRYQVTADCLVACSPITDSSGPTGVVRQAAPTVSVSAPSRSGRTLTASATHDGRPPRTLTRRWLRCDSSGSSCTEVPGAAGSGSAFKLTTADIGHRLRLRATVTNSAGTASATSTPTAVIAEAPPVSTSPPVVSGVAREGSTLTSTLGTWSGEGPIIYRRGWARCATADISTCSLIAGAASATYRLGSADVGRSIRSVVSAEGLGLSSRYSSPVVASLAFIDPGPVGPAPSPSLLNPFPRVAISGRARRSSTVVTKLLVRAPRGSRVTVRCRGRRCPVRRSSARAGRRAIRFRRMQRSFRAGVRLEVFVSQTGKVGSYTRFRFRRRRAPSRFDACLQPGASRPSRCPGK